MSSNEDYIFKIDKLKPKHSKVEIIGNLQEYARVHGVGTFRRRDYDAWNKRIVKAQTISRTFHSWGRALQAAGLRSERIHRIKPIDLKEMVTAFKACWRQHDSPPSRKQLEIYLEQHSYPFRWTSYHVAYGGHTVLARMIADVHAGRLPESALYQKVKHTHKRETISPKLRTLVLKRDRYRCVKCGATSQDNDSVRLEVDHIVPVTRGGPTTLENLQTLCSKCKPGKSDRED